MGVIEMRMRGCRGGVAAGASLTTGRSLERQGGGERRRQGVWWGLFDDACWHGSPGMLRGRVA